jgi:sarcosine oxidase delta subunit
MRTKHTFLETAVDKVLNPCIFCTRLTKKKTILIFGNQHLKRTLQYVTYSSAEYAEYSFLFKDRNVKINRKT